MPADHDLTPRERAAKAIMANPEWSDRAIAREAAVSITTVRNARSRIPPRLKPRELAAKALAAHPGLSLPAIAKKARVSRKTVQSAMTAELANERAKAIAARKKKSRPRLRRRVVPPPLRFDLNGLPGSGFLTERETAAAVRQNPMVLTRWRKGPNHPLRWRMIGDRLMCEIRSIREFLLGDAWQRENAKRRMRRTRRRAGLQQAETQP